MLDDCDICKRIITDEQIEIIAQRAAEKAVEQITRKIYEDVGRKTISGFLWIVGAVSVGLYLLLQQKGLIK